MGNKNEIESRALVEEIRYENTDSFLTDLSYGGRLYSLLNKGFVFRGISSEEYQLLPSALRKDYHFPQKLDLSYNKQIDLEYNQIDREYRILKKFFDYCDINNLYVPIIGRIRNSLFSIFNIEADVKEEWISPDLYELAALAQHYGLPTRLLDWSYSLLTALYFAVSGRMWKDNNTYKSDNIVLWAFDTNMIGLFNPQVFPLKVIRPTYNGNPNLAAQKGLFTLWSTTRPIKSVSPKYIETDVFTNREPLDSLLSKFIHEQGEEGVTMSHLLHMYKIVIPATNIVGLYNHLKKNGVDASSLFPGYQGVVRCMQEDFIISTRFHDSLSKGKEE